MKQVRNTYWYEKPKRVSM